MGVHCKSGTRDTNFFSLAGFGPGTRASWWVLNNGMGNIRRCGYCMIFRSCEKSIVCVYASILCAYADFDTVLHAIDSENERSGMSGW